MSLTVHILPETTATLPLWVCAEVRLIAPLCHPSVNRRINATYSLNASLPGGRLDAVIMQRGGWPGLTLSNARDVVRGIRARGAKLIYDIDDDLLTSHPIPAIDMELAERRPIIHFLASEADTIICSTKALAERFTAWQAPKKIWRNALDERLIQRRSPNQSKQIGKNKIGYAGTASHLRDLLSVTEPVRAALANRVKDASLEFIGATDPTHLQGLFGPWLGRAPRAATDYKTYLELMQTEVRWDVAIAPLIAGRFNEAKSDIKFLEYSAFGFPGVYSASHAYSSVVPDELGIIATRDGFGQAILDLLDSPERRALIAENAYEYVIQERTLAAHANDLVSIIETAL